jgi:hypothetical protein
MPSHIIWKALSPKGCLLPLLFCLLISIAAARCVEQQ